MHCSLIINFCGPDKAGIVEHLAQIAHTHDASWRESRLVRLGGHFTGLVHLSVPEKRRDCLESALILGGRSLGLEVFVQQAIDEPVTKHRVFQINVVGTDREGIVVQLSQLLRRFNVNIEESFTESESAPISGELIFSAGFALTAPEHINVEALREALETLADALFVDLQFSVDEG